ncbi:MAG: type II toxin-antitoxin system VapC family toxin [Rhodospirillales bacterium]|nr:type II toxin-antitoxin system VapC family toxin [Rhodospirillales bacterium]
MPFVLDAAVAACWLFDDEDHPHARHALARIRGDEARVPSLWWFEVRNTLLVSERRGRLTGADTTAFLAALSRLPIGVDRTPGDDVLVLADGETSPSTMPPIWSWRGGRTCRWRRSYSRRRGLTAGCAGRRSRDPATEWRCS